MTIDEILVTSFCFHFDNILTLIKFNNILSLLGRAIKVFDDLGNRNCIFVIVEIMNP